MKPLAAKRAWEIGAGAALLLALLAAGGAYLRQKQLNRQLATAIDAHDPDRGWRLVQAGADVNTRGPKYKASLLYNYCEQAEGAPVDQVRALLARGARVNFPDGYDPDALAMASQTSSREVVELLLAAGARVNGSTPAGTTPLMGAACEGKSEVVRLLLRHGAQVDTRDSLGETALTLAVYSGSVETVRVLLDAGASPLPTPLAFVNSPLHQAAYRKNGAAVLRVLLRHGVNVDAQDEDEDTPLHIAASAGYLDRVKLLLAKGARTDIRNRIGETALDQAEDDSIVRLLKRAARRPRRRTEDQARPAVAVAVVHD